jgi:hypothetical protein
MQRLFLFLAPLVIALPARALEPRFDHRDQHGVLVELGASRDTAGGEGVSTRTNIRPALFAGYTLDATGNGDEAIFGISTRQGGWGFNHSPVSLALDARFRGLFGSEAFKTFFELGIWAPVHPRAAVGPRAALGALYDFSRQWGLSLSGSFGAAFGEARIISFGAAAAFQIRWE